MRLNYVVIAICLAAVLMLALAGCNRPPEPLPIVPDLPPVPAECVAVCPAEPKLPRRDITDDMAARDRIALKAVLRCEFEKRRTCAARLKVLLEQ